MQQAQSHQHAQSDTSQNMKSLALTTQHLECILEATPEILLPRICLGPTLFMKDLQLLSFRLFYFQMGDFCCKAVYLSLERGIVSNEAVHLGFQR
jgi:hypothetical protein